MVLHSMPAPRWLSPDAPQSDVVLSTRFRVCRNLRGHHFPHRADPQELDTIRLKIQSAVKAAGLDLETFQHLTHAERDFLLGCRLLSVDFPWTEWGRVLLLDESRTLSLMVNEEDHLRLQTLTAGWSLDHAAAHGRACLDRLEKHLDFAWSPLHGYLAASPYNAGEGLRLSCMMHLIGLAHSRRLPQVLRALAERGLSVRGLFGESSRAVGAFVQISVIGAASRELKGSCDYLIREEREARAALPREELRTLARQAIDYAIASRALTLGDALRVLAWARWASVAELKGFTHRPREIDTLLTTLEIRGRLEEKEAAKQRAQFLRHVFES